MFQNNELYEKAQRECEKIFEDKKLLRKLNAQKPIEEKIKDLIKLQNIMVNANPELKKSGLIPWKID
jgi:hypothetical protein